MNDTTNIVNLPEKPTASGEVGRTLSRGEWGGVCADASLQAFRSVLEAIRNRVLVPARDIRAPQRKEIARELSLMHVQLEVARKARGLPDLPGTCHLMREHAA